MKKLLIALLIIFLLVIGVATFLWFNPSVFLNEKNLIRVAKSADLDLHWNTFRLDFKNTGLLSKEIILDTEKLCLNHPPRLDFCFDKILVQFHFSIQLQKPYVAFRDLNLDITSKYFYVTLPDEQKEGAMDKPFQWPRIHLGSLDEFLGRFLAYLPEETIKNIHVDMDPLVVNLSKQLQLNASLKSDSTQEKVQLKTTAVLNQADVKKFEAQLNAVLTLQAPIRLQAEGAFTLPGPNMTNNLQIHWQDRPEFTLKTTVDFKKLKIDLETDGSLAPKKWTLKIAGDIRHSSLPFERLIISDCPIQLAFQNDQPSQLEWPCDFAIANLRVRRAKGLPKTLEFKTNLVSPLNFDKQNFSAHPVFKINMEKSSLGELHALTQIDALIDLDRREIKKLQAEQLKAELFIPSLTAWERLLKDNRWAIPAPFNVLKGSIRLTAASQSTELLRKNFSLYSSLQTDLASETQTLKTSTQIELDLDLQKPLVTLSGIVSLDDISIDLPYLGIEQPPQFKPDARFMSKKKLQKKIKKDEESKATNTKFVIDDLRIKTARPMRFSTRLLDAPIPIDINYHIRKSKFLTGQIMVRQMGLNLFKRKATLQKFNITNFKDSDVQDLDGLITYKTSELLIKILIIGTTEKPTIELLSVPPLSRQQILSVLLYNKSLQQLADEEKSTASQMDQALLNNAFGLISLFFLSSTPIESVYYDPTTQSYTAQVRLDDQTSLSLGSDFEKSQQFTLRRRLGGPWSISTELEQTEDANDVVTTLVEWFKRF